MLLLRITALCAAASLAACSDTEAKPIEAAPLDMGAGARIDGSQDEAIALEQALAPKAPKAPEVVEAPEPEPEPDAEGSIKLHFNDLSLDELDDIQLEDLLDALLYPDEYEDAERIFPDQIQRLDKQEVALKGYMIPVNWDDKLVTEFMLVRDLLACCFGGAPQPDEWVSVTMPEGEGAEYFTFLPVIVHGTFHISALEDEAGYAAGCFRMDGETVVKEK
ncbi:MAG: hypothetical protein ACI8QC_002066 [Planctomycetota bacterium]|jgi:hypothetical protein